MKTSSNIRLGVNIDHAATLRQVRGGTTDYPNLLNIAKLAVAGGAEQITIHLREDRRHIQEKDLALLSKELNRENKNSSKNILLNLEIATTHPMVRMALKYKPDWVCFVPEKREELTTEGGLDVVKAKARISKMIKRLQVIGIEISMFIEPSIEQVKASFDVGADAVEFHTGKWVLLKNKTAEWKKLCRAAEYAHSLGLGVHAGHGLDFQTTASIQQLPYLREVNIGHSLICYSLEYGLEQAVKKMADILK